MVKFLFEFSEIVFISRSLDFELKISLGGFGFGIFCDF